MSKKKIVNNLKYCGHFIRPTNKTKKINNT